MRDIVEQVRQFDRWDGHTYRNGFGTAHDSKIPFEAASEIVRLRARIAELEAELAQWIEPERMTMGRPND